MFKTLRNAWAIPDLRHKMLYTLLMIFIFRLGSFIPVPGLREGALASLMADVSGGGTRIGFEGGQMPTARRIPKRGFNNIFAKPYEIINLSALNAFEDGETVTAEALLAKGILSKCVYGYKVLGNGKVTKKVTVQASAFSTSAKEAIEAAGGKAEVI